MGLVNAILEWTSNKNFRIQFNEF